MVLTDWGQPTSSDFGDVEDPHFIGVGKSHLAGFSFYSGFFLHDKFLPLKHAPIVVELELVGNAGDCLNTTGSHSTAWKITEPHIKCDIVTLDSELQNAYAAHLLSGKSLPTHFSSYATNVQTIVNNNNTTLPIARSCARLESVFVGMFHGDGTHATQKSC